MAAKPADKDRCEAWTHLRLFVERRPSYPDEAVLMHSDNEDMIRMKHLRAIVRPEIQPREGDTPRTDAQPKAQYRDAVFQELVAADFARQLERELASKTRDADHFFQLSGRYLEELNAVQSAIQPSLGEQVAWVATDPGGGRVLFWKHTFDAEWVAEHYPNAEPLYALSATGASIPYRATIKFDHETREVRGTLDLPVDTTVHKEKP